MDNVNQIVPPPVDENSRRPINRIATILIIVVVLVIAGLIYLGRSAFWQTKPDVTPAANQLTDAQKAEILRSLEASPKPPPLTDAQKAEILEALTAPSGAPPITEAEKAEILKSLQQ